MSKDSAPAGETGQSAHGNWPKDSFGRAEMLAQLWWLLPLAIFLVAGFLFPVISHLVLGKKAQVIVYTSQDQVYAEPILQDFTKQTGIKVQALYDSEAVKTVGLANRLLAERANPQCDVFWNNEELRTRQLATQNLFRETNGWTSFGYRSRRMVVNTNKLSLAAAPRSLLELTNRTWHGKVALAYPLFGTTATHFLALRQRWGESHWLDWCRALQANKPFLLDGNSVVVNLVGRGEAWIGLTDSDDIASGQREGLPLAALPMGEETLLIPNTVAVIRNAPHPQQAQRLLEYLQRREIVEQLVAANALEGLSGSAVSASTLKVDWDSLLAELNRTTEALKNVFLR